MHKIRVKIGKLEVLAEISEENPGTVKKVFEQLPIEGTAQRWGEEIYFLVGFDIAQEIGRQECEPGEIGFWPGGPGLAIFWGKTPVSDGEKPKAYSPCNFFAKLVGDWSKEALNAVRDGEKIVLSKAE